MSRKAATPPTPDELREQVGLVLAQFRKAMQDLERPPGTSTPGEIATAYGIGYHAILARIRRGTLTAIRPSNSPTGTYYLTPQAVAESFLARPITRRTFKSVPLNEPGVLDVNNPTDLETIQRTLQKENNQ